MRKTFAIILILIVGFALYRGAGMLFFAFSPAERGSEKEELILIQRGQTGTQVAGLLRERSLIASERRFLWLGQIMGKWSEMKAGEYRLSPSMTPIEVFSVITSGVSASHPLTIREGENIFQIAASLENAGLVQEKEFLDYIRNPATLRALGFATPLPPSLEGYLFPETYHFNRTQDVKEIVSIMHSRFKKEWTKERQRRATALGFTRHQVVTLASIIEKETGAPAERPLISSVFHNRLRKKMRLASDPTTIYGIWENFSGNLKRKHLKEKNDFNTYARGGLPIGPIANPGTEALQAALFPVDSDFLYFVSKNDGTHQFSRTLKEHNEAVRRYQLNQAAREGKSWRDLKAKDLKSENPNAD